MGSKKIAQVRRSRSSWYSVGQQEVPDSTSRSCLRLRVHVGATARTAGCHLHSSGMKNYASRLVAPERFCISQHQVLVASRGASPWVCGAVDLVVKQLLCNSDAGREGGQWKLVALKTFWCTGLKPFSLCRTNMGGGPPPLEKIPVIVGPRYMWPRVLLRSVAGKMLSRLGGTVTPLGYVPLLRPRLLPVVVTGGHKK